ncbi:hypothetical protein CLCR_04631 [Cladophialophora carrionii]|uniref:Uncharacterized protein n=1 Tax=Cladophialophora carrionii TaxID=86049 RepID=A0A1C1CKJ5_9EURO|nr:hypothetical protein CLCR_04631 [Cladophialophora carrionii]
MHELGEEIVLLRLLTAEPTMPARNVLVEDSDLRLPTDAGRMLSLANERDIVDNLAFLSATSNEPEKVTAMCLEEGPGSDSCTIRIAMNSNKLSGLVADFDKIARILETADRKAHGDCLNELLDLAVAMNRNRILTRLRSKHAKSSRRIDRCGILTRLGDMVEAVDFVTPLDQATAAKVLDLKFATQRLAEIFSSLETLPVISLTADRIDSLLLRLLESLEDLPASGDLRENLARLPPVSNFQGQEAVVMTIIKLRKYRAASDHIARTARRLSIFRRITVSAVTLSPCKLRPLLHTRPEQRFLDCLERVGLSWNTDTELRLGVSLPHACAQFTKEMTNLQPKVHAEIQLLFHYEINPTTKRPRVICSSKNACFLCELFIRLHGKFFVERTHGVLYPKWTLPDVEKILRPEMRRAIDEVITVFCRHVRAEIREKLANIGRKRMHPSESATSLTQLQPWMQSDESFGRASALSAGGCSRGFSAVATDTGKPDQVQQGCEITKAVGHPGHGDGNEPPIILSGAVTPPRTADNATIEARNRECLGDDDRALCQREGSMSSVTYRSQHCPSLDEEAFLERSELGTASQVRSSIGPECVQRQQTASTMRGHGSRTSNTPAKNDTPDLGNGDDHVVSHLAGVSQKFDFHDLELFLEFPWLSAVIEVARLDSTPPKPYVGSVVDVGSLVPGDELVVDLGEGLKQERILFLTRRDRSGMQSWWKVRWEYVGGRDGSI